MLERNQMHANVIEQKQGEYFNVYQVSLQHNVCPCAC